MVSKVIVAILFFVGINENTGVKRPDRELPADSRGLSYPGDSITYKYSNEIREKLRERDGLFVTISEETFE